MPVRARTFLVLVLLMALASVPSVAQQGAAGEKPGEGPAKAQEAKADEPKKGEEKKPEEKKPEEDKPFDEVVKDMEVLKGLFTFYRKADENKVLMEILPEQLDRVFLFTGSLEEGIGEKGIYAAQMGGDFPFYFRRVGKGVQWVQKNTRFHGGEGTPEARFTARSFPDPILAAAKILSKPHPERKSVLVDVAELFLSDLPGLTIHLNVVYQPTSYRFDKDKSFLEALKPFPENVLLALRLHYATDNPRVFSQTSPDERSLPVLVIYELASLPETAGFKPRPADDRVGHFHTVQWDSTTDRAGTPYLRYVQRWHLEKSDPRAKVSPPKQPIVFWLENTVPAVYREAVTEGVLLWNKAFERIGIQGAIVVRQQPDDADWDPADSRYNTIRWFSGVDATFAIGPSRANPFTGQIYDADIGFSEGTLRSVRRQAEEFVGPIVPKLSDGMPWTPLAWGGNPRLDCTLAEGLAQQAAFGLSVLDARGLLAPEVEERVVREWLIYVTAHEVGHTLGFRHNFRASTLLKLHELHDLRRTAELSQASSVMDYIPMAIAPKGQRQGHFMPVTLGPYDYWAVEYAYKPIEGDEKAELARIASRVADPLLPYSTDEDAIGTFSPQSMDPLANQYDHSDDPLAYFTERVGLIQELWDSMESKLARPGEGYQILRRAVTRSFQEYNRALVTSSKFVGGVYHYRDHAGDPNGRPPFVPVPATRQREALEFLREHAFSEKAFQAPSSLHAKLNVERLWGFDLASYFFEPRLDFPWHDAVLAVQRNVLERLLHPIVLLRIQDNELRMPEGQERFGMAELFSNLDSAIWSELDGGAREISSLRRNLQREHLKQLIRLTLRQAPSPPPPPPPAGIAFAPPPTPRYPEDATTLARFSLATLQGKIAKALASPAVSDLTTRAHLEESQARLAAALQAQVQRPPE